MQFTLFAQMKRLFYWLLLVTVGLLSACANYEDGISLVRIDSSLIGSNEYSVGLQVHKDREESFLIGRFEVGRSDANSGTLQDFVIEWNEFLNDDFDPAVHRVYFILTTQDGSNYESQARKLSPDEIYTWQPSTTESKPEKQRQQNNIGCITGVFAADNNIWTFTEEGNFSTFIRNDGIVTDLKGTYELNQSTITLTYTEYLVANIPQELPETDVLQYTCEASGLSLNNIFLERRNL